MTKVRDVKDRSPNQETVKLLRGLLEDAEAGEIRTIIAVTGDCEDAWGHVWSMDSRNTFMRMIGAASMMQFELQTNESLRDPDSLLRRGIEGDT